MPVLTSDLCPLPSASSSSSPSTSSSSTASGLWRGRPIPLSPGTVWPWPRGERGLRGGWELGQVRKGHRLRPCIPRSKFPQTATEWAEILALQKQFHSVEVHKWRQILRASVELLDEVRLCEGPVLGSHPVARTPGPQFLPL